MLRWPDGRRQAHLIDLDRATIAGGGRDRGRARTADARDAGDRLPRRRAQEHVRPRRHLQALLFVACNHEDLGRLGAIVTHLDRHELGLYPVSWRYRARLVLAYVRRWRETVVYAQALWLLKVRKLPIWLVEEAILKRSAVKSLSED